MLDLEALAQLDRALDRIAHRAKSVTVGVK
jgi:hypothetical protein